MNQAMTCSLVVMSGAGMSLLRADGDVDLAGVAARQAIPSIGTGFSDRPGCRHGAAVGTLTTAFLTVIQADRPSLPSQVTSGMGSGCRLPGTAGEVVLGCTR